MQLLLVYRDRARRGGVRGHRVQPRRAVPRPQAPPAQGDCPPKRRKKVVKKVWVPGKKKVKTVCQAAPQGPEALEGAPKVGKRRPDIRLVLCTM